MGKTSKPGARRGKPSRIRKGWVEVGWDGMGWMGWDALEGWDPSKHNPSRTNKLCDIYKWSTLPKHNLVKHCKTKKCAS